MAFQNKAGSIILDATLTDVGRKLLAKGQLNITSFALGDDEIDYSIGVYGSDGYSLDVAAPTLEAPASSDAAIIHGLVDYSRNDIKYLPSFKINTKLKSSVSPHQDVFYLSVNEETTKKLASAINLEQYILQSDDDMTNTIVFEGGIDNPHVQGKAISQARFIDNLELYDGYVFVYTDSRFIDKLLIPSSLAKPTYISSDNKEVSSYQPLDEQCNISMKAPVENYDTYYCKTVRNNIYDETADPADISEFNSARSCLVPLNFKVNPKMKSKSNGAADIRYTKFGSTGVNLFSDGNLYDYVDTNIKIEGCATTRSMMATIRVIRFSGT